MAEFIEPYDLPEDDEQRRLHLERYMWAFKHLKGTVVANAACSTNYGSNLLSAPGRLVIGFDRNDAALRTATEKGRWNFIKVDIEKYRFDGFVSLVCLETFEHLSDPWLFLSNLAGSVKELVISVPCVPTRHFNEWHLTDFTEQEMRDGLLQHGWNVQHVLHQDEQNLPKPTYFIAYATR